MRTDRPIPAKPMEMGIAEETQDQPSAKGRPLIVDLDDVLRRPGLAIDAAVMEIAANPRSAAGILAALFRGRKALHQRIARSEYFEPAKLLYDTETTASLLRVLAEGRPVYLVSTVHERPILESAARYLGIAAGWSASDDATAIAEFQRSLGPQGFERFERKPDPQRHADGETIPQADWRSWAKLLRVHQYAKNALVFVPLLTSHQFALLPAAKALVAAIAFSLCASSAYILNDLVDVNADRLHSSKRHRPIASGLISPARALIAMILLLAAAVGTAWSISPGFLGALLGYLALTTLYSFWLKRIMLADVVTLAVLYTVRVIAGSLAINVVMSEWLLAFSLFIFMSLALVKRYVEMAAQPEEDSILPNRDYLASDRAMVAMLAAASGFNTVVVFTLYISSEAVRPLYAHPQLLWIACPILIYWISRVMMLAHRRMIDDDPVTFALKDKVSWISMAAIGAVMLVAM